VFRGTLLAAAVVVVVAVVAVVAARTDDGSRAARVATRPTGAHHPREPVIASLRLDASVVHRGQDVLATVVFRNRSDRTIDVRDAQGCPKRWAVVAGEHRPEAAPEFADCSGRGRALTFPPGTTTRRTRIPTSAVCTAGRPCGPTARVGRANVWLLADAPEIRVPGPARLRVIGIPSPPFCRASDLVITSPGPTRTAGRYRLVVRNPTRTCELLGAPIVSPPAGPLGSMLPDRRPPAIRLRRGRAASFTVTLTRATGPGCSLGGLTVQLPNGGGTMPVPGPLPFGAPPGGCTSIVAARPSNFAPEGPLTLTPGRARG
jgi:hypothetical protein